MKTGRGKLQGKFALVTGSNTGIGRETALEFARQGADVAIHYPYSSEGADEAVEEIRSMGRRSTAFQADFNELDASFKLVDQAVKYLGGIDILVNNAGISVSDSFVDVAPEIYDMIYNVNMRAQFFCAQRAVKYMLTQNRKGVIINTTSSHAKASLPGFAVYAGTKGAIWSWTKQLAVELAPLGIRVNGICPGWIQVESYFQNIPDFDPISIGPLIPYQRMGEPIDIAKACVFLASADSDYLVGHVLVVDGGTLSKLALPDHRKTLDEES
jgi:NAD(P)-dependent dehydrogenase (short-subunit alcohol dehydrogenase family)